MDEKKKIAESLSQWADLPNTGWVSWEKFEHALHQRINDLIRFDFPKLIELLYRVDIDEKKLKALLHQEGDKDAATIISQLIIERQLQKAKLRKNLSRNDNHESGEEKW